MHPLFYRCSSHLFGWLGRLYIPKPFRRYLYGKLSPNPETHYPTLNTFFTRAMPAEARPISSHDLVFPCDGSLLESGPITATSQVTAKGQPTYIHHLINANQQDAFSGGSFYTIYLSPKDCHRVFSPVSGTIESLTYIPGYRFSVAPKYTQKDPNIYIKNERVITQIKQGNQTLILVMVGAVNVGKIRSEFAKTFPEKPYTQQTLSCNIPVSKGDWLHTFHLGSSVILISNQAHKTDFALPFSCQYGQGIA